MGTTNTQLNNIAKYIKLKNFRGVIMRDEILKMKPLYQECGILGSKTSKEDNMHWTCWWKNGDKKYYFDSFGLIPTKEILDYLKVKDDLLYSTYQIQSYDEAICGEYCMMVLCGLNMGLDYRKIVDSLVNKSTF